MRLSIVIVAFGGDLRPLLEAIEEQRADGDEVIVVDNAAGAVAPAAFSGHRAVDRVIEMPDNAGFAAAANAGAAAAAGDALVLLNPDALPRGGCLEALRTPPAAWAAWSAVVTLPGGKSINTAGGQSHYLGFSWVGRLGEPVASLPHEPHPTGFLSGACLAIRLRIWRELGGLPAHYYLYHEDVDLSHRLRLAGHAFGVLPSARVEHDYAFDKGAYKWRRLERNRWVTIIRTYPSPLLRLVLPLLLACELPLLAVALAGGWSPAKVRAWVDVARWLPRGRGERRAIQATAAVSARTFAEGLTSDLDSPLFGAVGRSRIVAAALGAYWRSVLGLLERRS